MKLLLLFPALFLMGMADCEQSYSHDCRARLRYTHDAQTDLCFASCGWGESFNFTWVPCTEDVYKAIKRQQ